MLKEGSLAPDIELLDQHEKKFSLKKLSRRTILVYFYPKADTPGCTQQSCGLRDIADQIGKTVIVGISPDKPSKLLKFDEKFSLGFTLLSDDANAVAKKYKVWKKKSMYGREYMGIERSAFLINGKGEIVHAWYKISPKDTPLRLLESLKK
ncbi:MAG: bacterioferritin comigratory protein [Acidimicrobiia bacterium BACL6 MAG-120924-bin43]|uniref:thioredoxin-dependent peroxiredoxin n=1 Tax=Acidimicrobiia bacterium BACL6 MAG-120924-bin43 TaxID=1655583 RepID=A0A0R2Q7M5_9ACTN|nr:MAG: bacterioferritin comigratory protein [Acidimicrobiia bacterium BACL6 MAG-120924-bin43]